MTCCTRYTSQQQAKLAKRLNPIALVGIAMTSQVDGKLYQYYCNAWSNLARLHVQENGAAGLKKGCRWRANCHEACLGCKNFWLGCIYLICHLVYHGRPWALGRRAHLGRSCPLLGIVIVDGTPVLCSRIIALAVLSGGVHMLEEGVQQPLIPDLVRVVDHLHARKGGLS